MQKIYKISAKALFACFLLIFSTADAQMTVITNGNYTVGGVTNDGIVSMNTPGGAVYKWDANSGMSQIGAVTNGYPIAGRTYIANDGSKIASSITNPSNNFNEISLYDVSTSTWTHLGGLVTSVSDGSLSSLWGMNASGSILVGLSQVAGSQGHAVKWDATNGMTDLGSIVPGMASRAAAVNADGSVIAGWQDEADGTRSGAKWVNGIETYITDNAGNHVGEAGAISADGNIIVGTSRPNPYVWNSTTGLTYITHPNASTNFRGGATGISANGEIVIGFYRPSIGSPVSGEGFIWTNTNGRINLNDYATSQGVNTQGITMSLPTAISQDGTKIAGMGLNTSAQLIVFYLDLSQSSLSTTDITKKKGDISIFPNPVKDIIFIKGAHKIQKAEIYNMVGQKILSFDSVHNGQIDVSSISKGDYVLQLSIQGDALRNFKFIKL